MKIYISLVFFIGIIVGQNFDNYRIRSPYISPGIQIGINSDKQLFLGFQFSTGIIIQGHSPNENIETLDFISPAFCYGYKKYFKTKNTERYYDLQVTIVPDLYDAPILGFGIGKINSADYSNLRLKAYTFFLAAANVDFELKSRKINLSIIPVFPIGNY